MEMDTNLADPKYGSFGSRMCALITDGLIVCGPLVILQFTVPFFTPLLALLFYKAVFEASALRATPGKYLFNLTVVDSYGQRLGLKQSIIRYLISVPSCAIFLVGYLVMFFTQRKQAAHDLLADTCVVYGKEKGALWQAWLDEMKILVDRVQNALGLVSEKVRGKSSDHQRLELIEKLNNLRTSGALSEEEFQKQKKQILGE